MAAVRHLKFSTKFRVYFTLPLSTCYFCFPEKNFTEIDNKLLSKPKTIFLQWQPSAIKNFKNFHILSYGCH